MAKIYNLQGKEKGSIELPKVFSSDYRPDLIKRSFLAIQSHKRQPYGADVMAGKRTSAHYHGVRKGPAHMMNREMSRMKRIHGGMPGLEFTARFIAGVVKGRKAHPPKAYKIWDQKVNKKENVIAIKSAIAATVLFELVSKKHKIAEMELPIIVSDEIQSVTKLKDIEKLTEVLNIKSDIDRAKIKKVRPGKGKMRGRKYKRKKSVLFIVSGNKGIVKAAKNLTGVDVCDVSNINVELLAPGAHAGRLTVFDEGAIKKLGELYG
ncbi:MAG: 50S ribosomal protein L4 [Nanoarchaeota archaeon]|nr:50S ribosomal protein L4 [Nanoarchaeota archaeon]